LTESGIEQADIVAEAGQQALQSVDDWWTVVRGSGYRWTLEQMDAETVDKVREANLQSLRQSRANAIETNVIFAVAKKR